MEEAAGEEGEKRKKSGKKVAIPKDRHAPKKPITAYNLYAADERIRMKKENPDRSFGEMNREIGSVWSTLNPEKKQKKIRNVGSDVLTLSIQPYLDQAEINRQKYMKEVEKYQKSDHYKKYLQTVAALQQRQQQKKAEKEQKKKKKLSSSKQPLQGEESAPAEPVTRSPSLPPPSRPPPLSLKQSFVAGTEIPVFTNQFLLHNRELEVQVRKLRQTTTDMEEETALISRHIDNMKRQTDRLESDIQNQILKNQILKKRLVFLQETLSDTFGSLTIPGTHSVPSVDTIREYLKEVESVVAKQPVGEDKQFDEVVTTVRWVAKETMERVRERDEGEQEDNTMDTTN